MKQNTLAPPWFVSLIFLLLIAPQAMSAVSLKIFFKDAVIGQTTSSQPIIYVKNIGTDTLKNFYCYYYFTIENGLPPLFEVNYAPKCKISMDSLGNGNYRLKYLFSKDSLVVAPNDSTIQFTVQQHYSGWTAWNKTNDYSYALDTNFKENNKISAYTITGDSLLYGVPPIPKKISYGTKNLEANQNAAIIPDTPVVNGAGLTWEIAPALPAGLSIDSVTGIIWGTPTIVSDSTRYIITGKNNYGAAADTIAIKVFSPVVAPTNLNYRSSVISGVAGTSIVSDTPSVSGKITSWKIAPLLANGLSFDTLTGIIFGKPVKTDTTAYIITASNSAGAAKDTVTISIVALVVAPVNLKYRSSVIFGVVGTSTVSDTPSVSGNITSWKIAPLLANGLSFDTLTGIIFGTPIKTDTAAYIITASNSAGAAKDTVTTSIVGAVVAPVNLHYRYPVIAGIIGTTILSDTPSVTGTVTSWNIAPSLSNGLTFNTFTGIISGTPVRKDSTRYVLSAANGAGVINDTVLMYIKDSSAVTTVLNTIRITKSAFDNASNSIKLWWTKDSMQSADSIGIAFSCAGYPDVSSISRVIPGNRGVDSATIALGGSIIFDTAYSMTLWLKRGSSAWSNATDSSRTAVNTPSFTWQPIRYFAYNNPKDTVYASNKRIRLCNDALIDPTTDTLMAWKPTNAQNMGFIPVSGGFYFKTKILTPAFFIGLKYDSLPYGHTASEVRVYRYDKIKSGWLVEKASVLDNAAGIVAVKTKNLDLPFIAMIDTAPPTVKHLGDFAPVASGVDISDTFIVSDNISNISCNFYYSKGEFSYASGDSDIRILNNPLDSFFSLIPAMAVGEDNGVRSVFRVSDGVHVEAVNTSRQAIRSQYSDIIQSPALQWIPLHATAAPDTPDIRYALRNFSVQGAWKYDNTAFRVFRWYPCPLNADTTNKYIEYTESSKNLFSIAPGNVLWVKTKNQTSIDFGRATTPPLSQPYTITLNPNGWTDIAAPYKFDVVIGDILASTQAAGQKADTLQWYRWKLNAQNNYNTDPVYIKDYPDTSAHLTDKSRQVISDATTAYAVYNPLPNTINLLIPPLPVSMSNFAVPATNAKKSAAGTAGWSCTITGQTKSGQTLGPVYCGFSAGGKQDTLFFAAPPGLNTCALRVCDRRKNLFGHALVHGDGKNGGTTFDLVFINNASGADAVEYSVKNTEKLPEGLRAMTIDPETGAYEPAEKTLSISLNAGQAAHRHLAVGTREYLAKMARMYRVWRLDMLGAYPNPFSSNIRIRYSLPGAGIRAVDLSIVSLCGRVVRETALKNGLEPGVHDYVWNGTDRGGNPVGPGIYIVRLTALDEQARKTGVFEKKITFVP